MNFSPGIVVPLVAALALYLLGIRHTPERRVSAGRLRQAAFLAGWFTLAGALVSPLHELGETLFSAHMAQHELLMVVAGPLLVWSRPLSPSLRGLPARWRPAVVGVLAHRATRQVTGALTTPAVAFVVHGATIWLWHAPLL